MPRVLILVHTFPKYSETFVLDHVLGLVACGFDVVVAARKLDAEYWQTLAGSAADQVRLCKIPDRKRLSRLRFRITAWRQRWHGLPSRRITRKLAADAVGIRALIRATRPDLAHAHFGPMAISGALAIGGRRLPLLADFHGYDVTRFPNTHGWELYQSSLERVPRLRGVVHSPFTRGVLGERLDVAFCFVPYGVDATRFTAPPRAHHWVSHLRLLSVGRLERLKGHHLAIEALASLRHCERTVAAELVIIGEGSAEDELRQAAASLGVSEAVEFAGAKTSDEVAAAMQGADILVMASQIDADGWQEAFGRVAIEAMASGLPVVGTQSGGLPFAIGKGGVVASGYEKKDIVNAVQEIMDKDSPCGWRERALAQANIFPIDATNEAYARVSRRLIDDVIAT